MAKTHVVVAGDTLSSLAATFYGDGRLYPLIADANGIANPNVIAVGSTLTIPDVDVTLKPASVASGPAFSGRPAADFAGTLPYASELFGVYQPLAGWFGQNSTRRTRTAIAAIELQADVQHFADSFSGTAARELTAPFLKTLAADFVGIRRGVLSPVGLVTLFREYFFEFDTFLGTPAGHVWISPGGTVELIESSTRRTLVDKTTTQSEEVTRKSEESLTSQDDVADAVKEDNANDTKLGASASAGASFAGIYHADASGSFSTQNTTHKGSEDTHKHARGQSTKVSSEIHRNFKTTFKVVTETTDTTSRRYVVQNTTEKLVNYELRRKMRKVGVQVQHIGTRLSWQVFLDVPGKDLGLGEMVHVVPAPDLSSIKKPEPPPPLERKTATFVGSFAPRKPPGADKEVNINMNFAIHAPFSTEILSYDKATHAVANADFSASPPAAGYTLVGISVASAKSSGKDIGFAAQLPIGFDPAGKFVAADGHFTVYADFFNSGDLSPIQLSFDLTWDPPAAKDDPAQVQYLADLADYNKEVAKVQRAAYGNAIRDRLQLVSGIAPRPSQDLRSEERQSVYGNLIRDLQLFAEPHLDSELIRQIFDVNEMLYFVAPDYWRPGPKILPDIGATTSGKYPAPQPPDAAAIATDPFAGETVVSWYSHTGKNNSVDPARVRTDQWRVNYLVTEGTRPAPMGSSLGWLIQIDGDERRNEFLNAAWVKAVLPIRPGHELDALDWLAQASVEGEAGLSQPYPVQPGDPPTYNGKTIGEVLQLLAAELQAANTDIGNTLASEKVFETGFDPLDGGFRPAEPYQIFDQWLEVLPTDQVVAVEVTYDPKTGMQL
jgi:LysM repeat protein